jgi:hypothetical protein
LLNTGTGIPYELKIARKDMLDTTLPNNQFVSGRLDIDLLNIKYLAEFLE